MVRGKHRFIVTGYRVLPKVPMNLHNQIEDMVDVVVQKTGMRTGALHIEFRIVDGHCKDVTRSQSLESLGSAMNRMIQIAFGIDLVEQTLKSHMGQKHFNIRTQM